MSLYVQYGCGLSAPNLWINFDSSPALRLQRTPVLNLLLRPFFKVHFPKNVRYGDIVKGLPVKANSCDGIYCSHVLEHLAFEDFKIALNNTYKVLKPGGTFRLVMPDLEVLVRHYSEKKLNHDPLAAETFIKHSLMGTESRKRGLKAMLKNTMGNEKHLWLWDHANTIYYLEKTGFKNIRKCEFGDAGDEMFRLVEEESRFKNAVALEMTK